MFITNAGHADWLVVFASTDKSKGHKGLSAFVVPTDLDGVVVEKHLDKMGQRATDTSGHRVRRRQGARREPARRGGRGLQDRHEDARFHRPGTAAGAVGVAQAAFDYSVEYAKTRVQFGQPIAMNQGINFLVADMATEIEAARLLVWQASWLLDQGKRATLQSSYAKRFAADTAMKVTTDAVQIFGGYVHEGVPRREAHARREAVPDLRGDVADPAARDREGDLSPSIRGAVGLLHVSLEIDLSGRVALVTGGSRGLGRADALTLAHAGADVVVADILVESDESAAEVYGRSRRRPRPGGS